MERKLNNKSIGNLHVISEYKRKKKRKMQLQQHAPTTTIP